GDSLQAASIGKDTGGFDQRGHVHRVRLAAGESADQIGNQAVDLAHQVDQRGVGADAVVDDPVHHVLDGPGQFSHGGGADHATGALEGVEGAAKLHQRGFIASIGGPAGKVLVQRLDDLVRLLDE